MVTLEGLALVAELVAAACVVITLAGFGLSRTKSWLICSVMAFSVLIATALVIIEATST